MLTSRLKKTPEGFHCNGCSKRVYDFRNCSREEIDKAYEAGSVCGIFNAEQLSHEPQHSLMYRMAFYGLVLISWMGFSVKPLKAQEISRSDSTSACYIDQKAEKATNNETSCAPKKKVEPMKKRSRFTLFRRRPIMGCPKF